MEKDYILLTPGPVPMPPSVYKALGETVLHHRTPEFCQIFEEVLKKLRLIFCTQQPVFIHTSTGSGAMESAIVNTLKSTDEVLCIVAGKFGERWADMCEAYGLKKVHRLNLEWGETFDLNILEKKLDELPQVSAVLTQYCETSTATLLPVQQIASLVKRKTSAMVMVDAITALGAVELPTESWELDVVVAGSQKAFMMPTGLSFITLSPKAWMRQKDSDLPKYYFDLRRELKANESGQSFFSSPVTHIKALAAALNDFDRIGFDQVIVRTRQLSVACHAAARILNIELFSKSPSPSVTALKVPAGIDGEKLRDHLEKKYKVVVMGGQDHLKGKILRIGHLGYISDNDLIVGFEGLAHALIDFGMRINPQAISELPAVIRQHLGAHS